VLRFVGLGRWDELGSWSIPLEPPDAGVREPRRPRPSLSGGAIALELPPDLQ